MFSYSSSHFSQLSQGTNSDGICLSKNVPSAQKVSTPKMSTCLRKCPLRKKAKIIFPYFHHPPDHRTPLPAPPTFCPTSVPQPGTEPSTLRPMQPATNHCATQADDQCAFFCSYIPRLSRPKMFQVLRKCPQKLSDPVEKCPWTISLQNRPDPPRSGGGLRYGSHSCASALPRYVGACGSAHAHQSVHTHIVGAYVFAMCACARYSMRAL